MIVATPKALAAWYKSVRTTKGLTQTEVADRCLMTQKQISEFENGKLQCDNEHAFSPFKCSAAQY